MQENLFFLIFFWEGEEETFDQFLTNFCEWYIIIIEEGG